MSTQQQRAVVGKRLSGLDRQLLTLASDALRKVYKLNEDVDPDQCLLELADNIDQIAKPIVVVNPRQQETPRS
jgi:hypothetical protein